MSAAFEIKRREDLSAATFLLDVVHPMLARAARGVLYRNDTVPCYEDLRRSEVPHDREAIAALLEHELDTFATD